MQRLGATRTSRLVWLDPPRSDEYVLDFGHARQLSELSVSLTLAPGEIALRRAIRSEEAEEDADVDADAKECDEDVLMIPVEVTLESGERALAESFRAVLEASSPHRGRLSARFEPVALAGGLTFTEPQSLDPQRSFQISAIELALLVWQGGSHGRVSIEIGAASRSDDGVAAPPEEARPSVAVWPSAAPCAPGWAALPPDVTLSGASARDVLDSLEDQPAEALRWSDGAAAELRLSFEALPNELCQSTGDVLEFETVVRAQSSDGRVDSRVPVRVVADANEIQVARRVLEVGESGGAAAPPSGAAPTAHVDFEARYRRGGASGSLEVRSAGVENQRDGTAPGALIASGEWSR